MRKIFLVISLGIFMCTARLALGQSNLSSGLIAWYPFSGNAADSSGNGHNGIVKNGTLTADRFGNANSAYYTDGSAKLMSVLALGDYGASGVTISLWVKTTSTDAAVEIAKGAVGSMYINAFTNGTFLADFCGNIKHSNKKSVSDSAVTSGNWVLLTATNDGSTTRIYVNGTLQNSFRDKLSTGGSDFIIGNQNFVGSIDDVRIYNRAILATEVSEIYALTH